MLLKMNENVKIKFLYGLKNRVEQFYALASKPKTDTLVLWESE